MAPVRRLIIISISNKKCRSREWHFLHYIILHSLRDIWRIIIYNISWINYTYNVSSTDFTCKHNIDDYIVEKDGKLVFNLRALARDIGWKYAGSQDTALDKQTIFIPYDETYGSDTIQVKFEEEDPYTAIYYVYSTGSSHSTKVQFVRSDLISQSAETSRTYYVNSALNGKTISRDMAVMFCYLLENISIDTGVNPLEETYSSKGPYNL